MLVFSTKMPLKQSVTQEQCLQLFFKWVSAARQYPFSDEDFAGYDLSGHEELEITKDTYSFSVTHYMDETVELSACRLVSRNPTETWTTQNVVYAEGGRKYLSVQTHCTKTYYTDVLPEVKPPFTIKLFIRDDLCDLDGGFPVCDKPIEVTDKQIAACGQMMQGHGENSMPVVYLSSDYWATTLDAASLARTLQGLAHVLVEPDIDTSRKLKIAADRSNVYRGYVGIYFPCLQYHRELNESDYPESSRNEKMTEEISSIIRNALLNQTDATKFSWDQIKALQHKQRIGKIEIKTAELGELREWYENFAGENKRLEDELADQGKMKKSLYEDNQRLRALLDQYRVSAIPDQTYLLKSGAEHDLYPGEQADLVIDALEKRLANLGEDTRPRHIVEALLAANEKNGTGAKFETTINSVFSGRGEIVSTELQNKLRDVGFSITKEGKHYKMVFCGDPRYTFTVSVTPSDWHGGRNTAAGICRKLFPRN